MSTYEDNLAHARSVLAAHKHALMARPEVTGCGIGAGSGGPDTVVIVVYLTRRPAEPLPEELLGVVVRGVLTGAFKAQ